MINTDIWEYTVDPFDESPIMEINTHIGFTEQGQGVDGAKFARELSLLDNLGKKSIRIYINSSGGRVDDGWTIFTSILRAKTHIIGYVGGCAASIAGVIFQACDERVMYPFSILMVHNPAMMGVDTTVDEDPMLVTIKSSLQTMLQYGTKLSDDAISKLMNEETWMLAKGAVDYGFADQIMVSEEEIEEIDLQYIKNNKLEVINISKRFDLVMNNIVTKEIQKNKNTMMKEQLIKLMNLSDKATDKDIVNSVKISLPWLFKNEMETECVENSEDIPDEVVNETDPDEMGDAVDYKAMYENAKKELNTLRNSKLVELVENSYKVGKIKKAEIETYINLGNAEYKVNGNINSLEKILNGMLVNKPAVSLTEVVNAPSAKEATEKVINEKKEEIKNKVENIINSATTEEKVAFDFNSAFKRIK